MAKRKSPAQPDGVAKQQKLGDEASPAAQRQQPAGPSQAAADQPVVPREKVLVLSTRGITFRYRHLMNDLIDLLPHCKKDSKLDTKHDRNVINEVADIKNCSAVIFFEVRKHQDLYIWMAKSPSGPSVKFHVTNVHTMAELKLSGNHLKGSRPVLGFDAAFDQQPHLQLLKELLTQIFATPKRHHKSKPFFDHVLNFSVADGRIWMRNYQVTATEGRKKADADSLTLVEVGPRLTLQPIKMFAGSFMGTTLYDNPDYVSPNTVRAALKKRQASKYVGKVQAKEKRKQHEQANPPQAPELDGLFKG